jgi:hypothetical protein
MSKFLTLIGLFSALSLTYVPLQASVLRTDMGKPHTELVNLNILDVAVLGGGPKPGLEILARNKKDYSRAWKCRVTTEVASKAGYSLGQLQAILLSDSNITIYCGTSIEGSQDAERIDLFGHVK